MRKALNAAPSPPAARSLHARPLPARPLLREGPQHCSHPATSLSSRHTVGTKLMGGRQVNLGAAWREDSCCHRKGNARG